MQRFVRSPGIPPLVFGVILLFGLLAMTARPATDPDLWWHLRTGQWIVETGQIPHTDPFSFTRAGQAWVSHEWLSEVMFYELWKHGRAAALIIFSAVVTTVGFMLLYLRCPGKRYWAAAATVVGALAAAPCWGSRPQMFTFLLASLLLWLVEKGEIRPKLLFWIPLIFWLWVNLHAGFALGPALLLAYGIGLLIEIAAGTTPWREARPILLRVLLLLAVCCALVPLNPSGAELYRYPFDTLRSPGMRSFIGEWFSPDFHAWLYRPLALVWLLLLIALASSFVSSRFTLKGRVIVPLLLTSFAALDAVRHIPIFILIAMPVVAAAIPRASAADSLHGQRRTATWVQPLFIAVVIPLMAALAVARWVGLGNSQPASEAKQFPEQALAFLESGHYPGRAFVYYDWGGYTLWKSYPEYRVFVDGRADLYGDDILRQFTTAMQLHDGWKEVLEGWKVGTVLVPPSSALAQALLLDHEWRTAFRDSGSIVFIREPLIGSAKGIRTPLKPESAVKFNKSLPRWVTKVKNCFPEPYGI